MIDKPFGEMKVGDSSVSRGRTVTETDIVNFAMIMGMWLELQTNDEFAEHTMYGKRIAQGPLIYTIAVGLMNIDGEILVALSGVDRMRMLTPVFVGDTLWAKTEITELRDREDDNGLVDLRLLCRKTRPKSPVGPGREK
ncbi:MAG: MaoC/PaaZ C-terminal domain-containing protein [Alphaproteobacteria bacterium]|nr:MaoC/PaaZ C-terminal domain-containing protein [Alphaproteobacteria bacterium]